MESTESTTSTDSPSSTPRKATWADLREAPRTLAATVAALLRIARDSFR